jgi:hypothetical protein
MGMWDAPKKGKSNWSAPKKGSDKKPAELRKAVVVKKGLFGGEKRIK